MSTNPRVSILVITYNQEKYIDETLRSLVNQDYDNLEIIVSDDCSTDSTQQIIRSYSERYPQVVPILNTTNRGITENSNIGMSHCSGEYLCYMGGDDVLYPTKISTQVDFMLKNPEVDLCGHNLDLIDEEGNKIGIYSNSKKLDGKDSYSWIKEGMLYGCMSILMRVNHETLELDERLKYSADLKFIIDYLSKGRQYKYLTDVLGGYRKSATSITASKWDECVQDSESMFQILKQDYPKRYQKSIKYGFDYLVRYGRALNQLEKGNKKTALKGFLKVISSSPTNLKAYYRILQTVFR